MHTRAHGSALAVHIIEHHQVRELRVSALAAAEPTSPTCQLEALLAELGALLATTRLHEQDVVRCTVFFAGSGGGSVDLALRHDLAMLLRRRWPSGKGAAPAISLVQQSPLGGGSVALDLLALAAGAGELRLLRRSSAHGTAVTLGALRRAFLVIAPGPAGPEPRNMEAEGRAALGLAEAELLRFGFGLDQVLRTWFYIPGILERSGASQRYQQLNEARSRFYERPRPHRFLERLLPPGHGGGPGAGGYPASTGIGAEAGPLVLELEALDAPPGQAVAFPIENPRQLSAYRYPGDVLVGDGAPAPPRFSRGLVELSEGLARVRVSGTASIRGSSTMHPGDVAAQTATTLETIELLVSAANLARHGLARGLTLGELAQLRIYVKRPEDLPVVSALCTARCGAIPMLYLQADICRDDLLVEIEAFGAFPL
ncbi:MAG: hypothetical protein FJ125_05935 [Deltaproteobacteria bacterium]|nr:hypothetical protein [Deltaproteobacteria bacterium]